MIEVMSSTKARAVPRRKTGKDGDVLYKTDFLGPVPDNQDFPQAFLVESDGERLARAHFHTVDQWQIFVGGNGRIGKHEVAPITIHYANAFTPYGPLNPGPQGLAYMTLRPRYDPGAQYLPEAKDRLRPVRKPFQVTCPVKADPAGLGGLNSISLEPISEIQNEEGLAAYVLRGGPNATTVGPNPETGNGQYYLVIVGSLIYAGGELPAWSCIFVSRDEQPLSVQAGKSGVEALVLQFARSPS